ncbi:MAG: WYL domain-containing protein, partial [Bifidobacteriaceae bacterium]|nr:WYL domain-containing protein [Bifidobacteriaceae bacterium]
MSASDQTAARLLNMIIVLMAHPRGLSRQELMDALEIAEERTFERAKDALRSALGVALEEADQGHYRLGGDGYAMPALQFSPPEHAAIALALGAWRGSAVEWAARTAMTKLAPLEAADAGADAGAGAGADCDADAGGRPGPACLDAADGLDTALYAPADGAAELIAAIADRRRVRFDYVTGATGRRALRRVEPWRLTKRGGAWYLFGFDLDRRAERVYKLSRVAGTVGTVGRAGAFEPPEPAVAAARFQAAFGRRGAGPALVRATCAAGRVLALQGGLPASAADAAPVADAASAADAASVADAAPAPESGGGLWRLANADAFDLAAWGGQVEVVEPARLRQAV